MQLKSTQDRYGAVAIAFHWVGALFILAALATGLLADAAVEPADKASWLRLHVPLALLTLVLIVLRLGWWWLLDRRPAAPPDMPRLQARAARLVHALLNVAVVVMLASGLGMAVLSGLIPNGIDPAALPDFRQYPPRNAHGLAAWILIALIAIHVAAAFYHLLVRRDRIFARMGLGR